MPTKVELEQKIANLERELESVNNDLSQERTFRSDAETHYSFLSDFFPDIERVLEESQESWALLTPQEALKEISRIVEKAQIYFREH